VPNPIKPINKTADNQNIRILIILSPYYQSLCDLTQFTFTYLPTLKQKKLNKLVKLTVFAVMLSRKAKHLASAGNRAILAGARFFASLRFAQNDKLPYLNCE